MNSSYMSSQMAQISKRFGTKFTLKSGILVNIFDVGFEMGGLTKTLFTKTEMKNKYVKKQL